MALTAKLYQPLPTGRQADRAALDRTGTLRDVDGIPVDVEIRDLSVTGVRLECGEPLLLGAHIQLGLPGLGRRALRVVRQEGDSYGCRFETPLDAHEIALAAASDTVAFGSFATAPVPAAAAMVEVRVWPLALRIALIVGMSGIMWTGIIGATHKAIA